MLRKIPALIIITTLVILLLSLASCSPQPDATEALPSGMTFSTAEMQKPLQEAPLPAVTVPALDTPAVPPPADQPVDSITLPLNDPAAALVPEFQLLGIEMHSITPGGGLQQVVDSGAYWLRRNALLWSDVEPQQGARNWEALSGLEQEMINASQNNLELIMIIRRTPSWAQAIPGSFCGPIRPDKLQAFADFVYDTVSRYSAPPYNVLYWELGNEPDIDPNLVSPDNVFGCWGDADDIYNGGGAYAEVLKLVYPRLKQANPQAQLLVGGLLMDCDPVNPPVDGSGVAKDCSAARYLEGILEAGGGDYFDGISFHAYDGYAGELGQYNNLNWSSAWNLNGPSMVAKVSYLRSLLNSYGYPEKYLINSENGLICGRDGTEPPCQEDAFELTKAYYAVHSYATARALDLPANIWYSIIGWRGTALVNSSLEPYPVYDALLVSADRLGQASYLGEVRIYPGVKGYEFLRGDTLVWLLWSLDGATHSLSLPQVPSAVYDVMGAEMPPGAELEIGIAPRYIEWGP